MSLFVVSNSRPLIALHQIGQLPLLETLFGSILIPQAVAGEVRSVGDLPAFVSVRRLERELDATISLSMLGAGECESIALAREVSASHVLLDDLPARRLAGELGLSVIGTLGILLAAKRRGILPAIRPSLDLLVKHGFRIAPTLFQAVLGKAGE